MNEGEIESDRVCLKAYVCVTVQYVNECTLLFMVIKASDSSLNLDERFRLTKRDKVRMKKEKGEKKKKQTDSGLYK